jgi:TFIIS helical bundle-like domain
MPDGTFPNINLVEGVLTCLDTLRVDIQHLEECEIAKVVQCYAENLAGIPSLQGLAKRIIEKWSRLIYGIKSHYADGLDDYEEGYKNLQKRLDKIRGNHVNSDLDEDDE